MPDHKGTTRRAAIAGAAGTLVLTGTRRRARAQAAQKQAAQKLKIGVLNDLSGTYRDDGGMTGVQCARQALDEFDLAGRGLDVELIFADHQNKADIGAGIVREWLDRGDVDVILDVPTSSVALAVNTVVRARNKVFLVSGGGTGDLTGIACTPNTIAWTYDTYMLANTLGTAVTRAGGDTWFMVTADYVFGQQLERDAGRVVAGAGGKVLGRVAYPFPETTDFSSALLRAQASGAKVLGLCNAGGDTLNCVKQAREFGLMKTMTVAALLIQSTSVHGLGLEAAQGLRVVQAYYWDLNDRTRAFNARVRPRTGGIWPNMTQAGDYAATLHYLKAVATMAPAERKDGAAVVARMKAMPTDDDCFGPGRIREDGRHEHEVYLFQVKTPAESKGEWDVFKLLDTTPADRAFKPMSEGGCPLVKA